MSKRGEHLAGGVPEYYPKPPAPIRLTKSPVITVKEHEKIVARKDAIITELANIVDEFRIAHEDYDHEYAPLAVRATKAVNKKAVHEVAWPPRPRIKP